MNKIILVFCAILGVANALTEDEDLKKIKEYLEKHNKEEQQKYLQDYFDNIADSVSKIDSEVIIPALTNAYNLTISLKQQQHNLTKYLDDQLDIFEHYNAECRDKYRSNMPNINETDSAMINCIQQYLNAIPQQPAYHMKKVYIPYIINVASWAEKCKSLKDKPNEYLSCFYPHAKAYLKFSNIFAKKYTAVVNDALSEYDAVGNNKKALECTKRIEDDVHNKTSEVTSLVLNCINGVDN